ncbi:MAG: hypothetical protein R3Y38_01605 [Rikenellaceae bacterium]
MKKNLKLALALIFASIVMVGCSCYNKMLKNVALIQASCSPEVLTLKGSKVYAEYTVTFPAKYFSKAAVVKVTPVLVYEGGEIAGTPKFVQGEDVQDNFTVIPNKLGGSFTEKIEFDYAEAAVLSTLELRFEGKCDETCSKKNTEFVPFISIPVAQGISTVQEMAKRNMYTEMCKDNFKRVYTVSKDAEILYKINSSVVNKAELSSESIALFKDFVKENVENERATMGNVYAKGYASPDGGVKFNDRLSSQRSKTGNKAISSALKGVDVKYDVTSYGEDWEGFKKLVEASDIEDKALILQVLQMYDNPVKRDEEIQNMAAVFKVLATEVLPKLRRTQLVADAEIQNLSDEEIKAAVKAGCTGLELETALFGATLYKDLETKIKVYTYAAETYNCFRAYNNLATCYMKQNKVAEAKTAIDKAASLKTNDIVTNNLAVLAIMEGKLSDAKGYLKNLKGNMAKANLALIALLEGEYATAAKTLEGYNLAVAQICNGDLAAATKALANEKSPKAAYLKAVIAMRQGDTTGAIANLKVACAKENLKAKSKKDVEFAKLFGTAEFDAL